MRLAIFPEVDGASPCCRGLLGILPSQSPDGCLGVNAELHKSERQEGQGREAVNDHINHDMPALTQLSSASTLQRQRMPMR